MLNKKQSKIKQKHSCWFVILTLIGIFIYSCQKEDDFLKDVETKRKTSTTDYSQGGRKLENPYTVENMREAFENIKTKLDNKQIASKGTNSLSDFEITKSHYYIKFKPETDEQEGILKRDSTMILFDYPLDWEFTDEYLENRPELPEGEFPEYYVAVPIDKTLPSEVPYEILEELYLPEEDPVFNSESETSSKEYTQRGEINDNEDLLSHLLNEAYSLTGNEDDLLEVEESRPKSDVQSRWIFGRKWYPSGTLQIWDDNAASGKIMVKEISHWEHHDCDIVRAKGTQKRIEVDGSGRCSTPIYKEVSKNVEGKYVPLKGAQVLIRQWFTIRQGITDQKGYFKTGSVRGSARYIIQWERYDYSIRNGSLFQAETKGPKMKGKAWNYNIKGGEAQYLGMIHTAAHIYYYGSRFGLTSPPKNGTLKKQMKIAARKQNGKSSHVHQRRFIHLAQIQIKEWGAKSEEVFGTTIHELAHAAHWNLDRTSYNNLVWDGYISDEVFNKAHPGDVRTLETWATTVEILFALNRYKDMFKQPNYEYSFKNMQNLEIYRQPLYTSAGFDMIDNVNQRDLYGAAFPIDRVSGYTVKQLEDGLKDAKNWTQWRDNIKARSNNPTEKYVDELFNNWK